MPDTDDRLERFLGLAFPAMVATRVVGAAISPLLFAHLPLALVIMSPFLIHLVAVAPLVTPELYFPVAIVVCTAQALVGYHFGHALGSRAMDWVMGRVPLPLQVVQRLLDWVRRASIPAIFVVPGPVMATVAGVAKVRMRIFHLLVLPAQAVWVIAAYYVGEALLEYIEVAREFVIDHAFILTGATVFVVILRLLYQRFRTRRRKSSERTDP